MLIVLRVTQEYMYAMFGIIFVLALPQKSTKTISKTKQNENIVMTHLRALGLGVERNIILGGVGPRISLSVDLNTNNIWIVRPKPFPVEISVETVERK